MNYWEKIGSKIIRIRTLHLDNIRWSYWEEIVSQIFHTLRLDTIKKKIVVFALLATLLPSLSTACISYTQNKRSLTAKITEELDGASSKTAREIDLWFTERQYDVRVFASSYEVSENLERIPGVASGGIAAFQALARLRDYLRSVQERFDDYEEFLVIDPTGRVVASSTGQSRPTHLAPEWLDDIRSERFVSGNAHWDETSKQSVITIAVPITAADGRFLGAMTAKLNFGGVREILHEFTPETLGDVYVVNDEGFPIISARSSAARLKNTTLGEEAERLLFAPDAGAVEYVNHMGNAVVGTLTPVPRSHWAVVAEIHREEAYAQVAHLRNLTIVLVSGLLLVVGCIAYFLGSMVARPLDRLIGGVAEVAAGELAVDLPVVSGGEVGYLTEVFNDMVARVREGRQKLDAINETLSQKNAALERLSVTDSLTGLYNRRHLMETLTAETRRSQRQDQRFSLMVIDVDHFKKFNDEYGHVAGDEVLSKIGAILRDQTRDVDCASRYGGEEFVVLLPGTTTDGAAEVAERIRVRLEEERFADASAEIPVTLSIGIAEFPPDGDTPESLLVSADTALYRAKRRGRNRVVQSSEGRRKQARSDTPAGLPAPPD